MNQNWNTPPGGDFASYVERLTQQAAMRALAQRAQQAQASAAEADPAPVSDEESARRARVQFAAPGRQLDTEHPVARVLRLALKKLEGRLLQAAAQQRQQKK